METSLLQEIVDELRKVNRRLASIENEVGELKRFARSISDNSDPGATGVQDVIVGVQHVADEVRRLSVER